MQNFFWTYLTVKAQVQLARELWSLGAVDDFPFQNKSKPSKTKDIANCKSRYLNFISKFCRQVE